MNLSRRRAVTAGLGVALGAEFVTTSRSVAGTHPSYKAIVFDGFPIFDVRPVGVRAEALFPGQGAALTAVWRTRQFEYQWLRFIERRYADFRRVTEDSLVFAATSLGIALTADARSDLLGIYDGLSVWPDVADALQTFKDHGIRLGILSNMTTQMLDTGLQKNNVTALFEHVISTDQIQSYKPAPASYQLAVDQFSLQRSEILFVPFAGWDAAGAKAFGYPTWWMNRLGVPPEELGDKADASGSSMHDLMAYLF